MFISFRIWNAEAVHKNLLQILHAFLVAEYRVVTKTLPVVDMFGVHQVGNYVFLLASSFAHVYACLVLPICRVHMFGVHQVGNYVLLLASSFAHVYACLVLPICRVHCRPFSFFKD